MGTTGELSSLMNSLRVRRQMLKIGESLHVDISMASLRVSDRYILRLIPLPRAYIYNWSSFWLNQTSVTFLSAAKDAAP